MATLDDQFLSGKSAGYCSSSSDEDEFETEDRGGDGVGGTSTVDGRNEIRPNSGSCNTGPKGVIEDWRRFKQLQTERRTQQEKELLALTKKLSMSCRSHLEDEKAKEKETEDELLKELDEDDDFIKEYMKRRMNELATNFVIKSTHEFGQVYELIDVDAFLKAVEQDCKLSTVVVHLYEKGIPACDVMNGCFVSLAQSYPFVKFCRVRISLLGASNDFRSKALPTLQAYRDGQLIGNFVRISDEFNEEYYADDVESFLKQYGILPDLSKDECAKLNDFASSANSKRDESDEDY